MATLYFTNNADDGAGSLRKTIDRAANGDVIAPDPSIAGELITISLSSTIAVGKELTFDGGTNRVRLDGQGAVRLVNVSSSASFINYDFIRGYNASTCGGLCATTNGASLTLDRCLIAGVKNNGIGDISSTSSSVKWSEVVVRDSVLIGGFTFPLSTVRTNSYRLERCTVEGYVGNVSFAVSKSVDTITSTPSTVGFLVAPPDDIAEEEWDKDMWRDWDLRLKPSSDFLHGATSSAGAVDFYGYPRKKDGALGAYEGSYIVVNPAETAFIATDTDVDRAFVYGDLTIAAGRKLYVRERFEGDGSIACENVDGRAYFAAPSIAYALVYDNVTLVAGDIGGVKSISASVDVNVFTVAVQGSGDYFVEYSDDLALWRPVVFRPGESARIDNSNALYFRAFDGDFHVSELVPRTYYYNGDPENGSFANPNDWTLDKAHNVPLTAPPTIQDGTFDCR